MAAGSPEPTQPIAPTVHRRRDVADKGRNADVGGHVPNARHYPSSFVFFKKGAAILVVYRRDIHAATRPFAHAARVPKRNGVVLDQLADRGAERLQQMIAC